MERAHIQLALWGNLLYVLLFTIVWDWFDLGWRDASGEIVVWQIARNLALAMMLGASAFFVTGWWLKRKRKGGL